MADPSRRAAVLGRPIAHSLSPLLHRAAYAALGLDWSYEAIDCGIDELTSVVNERADWAGFSCTMPLKRAVVALADELRPRAAAVGAANTLLPRRGGGWIAENTDVAGIVATMREADLPGDTATILGAGGTAQAAVAALAELGVHQCAVLVRDPERTEQLRATADRVQVALDVGVLDVTAPQLRANLVVATLPAGVADTLAAAPWHSRQVVLDVIYDPWPTQLTAAAGRAGADVRSGALLLLHQAAAQVELMTGRPGPVGAMRDALRAARPDAGL